MKSINLSALVFAVVLAGSIAGAGAAQKAESLRVALGKTSTAEVPAKAAELVSQADVADRDVTTATVVKLTLRAHPTAATAIVGAISAKTPTASPTAAATAAGLQPKQVIMIAHAAAKAAPAQAGAIVRAVCKAVPGSYREVALVVAADAPGATKEILAGLSEALPDLKPRLDLATASYHGNIPSVAAVLDRANAGNASQTVASTTPTLASTGSRGPSVSAPYIPLSGTPTNVPPGGGVVPPGGRNYAPP